MKKIIAVFAILIILISATLLYLSQIYPTTSPLKSSFYFIQHLFKPHAKMQKETIGFLPHWRLDDTQHIRLNLITEVNYFGLFLDKNGEIVKIVNGETNPGWREWESQKVKDMIAKTQIMGADFTLTIVAQNNDVIEKILTNPTSQTTLISQIIDQIKTRKLDGINIDFEYLSTCHPRPDRGSIDSRFRGNDNENKDEKCKIDELKPKFTAFSKLLKVRLNQQSPQAKVSLSIMPRAARSKDLFDFKSLVPIYDKFIGMSYEYAGQSNSIADATAPMTGFADNKFFFDVSTTYEDYQKVIPREKIIMGVPYYGWDWAVENGRTIQSKTLPSSDPNSYAAVMSYARAKEDKNLKKNQCKFDEVAKQPWCWYTDSKTNVDHQVWFEDEKSIGIKYDFAKEQDFKGVAIWVLGYDKNYPELWDLMKNKFGN